MRGPLVLCNVGVRDVSVERLPDGVSGARSIGEALLADLEWAKQRATAPIIVPVLQHLRHRLRLEYPMHVVLFATDQRREVGEKYWGNDTIRFAELLQKLLPEWLGFGVEVEVQRIPPDCNPSLLDDAYEAYGDLVGHYRHWDGQVFCVLSGGIPACNAAMLLQALRHFGERCQAIYKLPEKEPVMLGIGEKVRQNVLEGLALEQLGRLDFSGALCSLQGLNLGRSGRAAEALVEYAARRLNFDFDGALRCLDTVERQGYGPVREYAIAARKELEGLLGGDLRALLQELFLNARIAWEQGRYVDFLGRLFRFEEALLRFMVEDILGLPTGGSAEELGRWRAGILADDGLRRYLCQVRIGDEALDPSSPSRPVLRAVLEYALKSGAARPDGRPYLPEKRREQYLQVLRLADKWQPLAQLRNRSIIAHGFAGVSEDDLREELVKEMASILQILRIDVAKGDGLEAIVELVRGELLRAR